MPESILNVRVLGNFSLLNMSSCVIYTCQFSPKDLHETKNRYTGNMATMKTEDGSSYNSRVPKRPPRKWVKSSLTIVESTCSQLENQVSLHCNIRTQKQPPQVQKRGFSTSEFSKRNNERKDRYPLAQDTSKVQRFKLELEYKGTNLSSSSSRSSS